MGLLLDGLGISFTFQVESCLTFDPPHPSCEISASPGIQIVMILYLEISEFLAAGHRPRQL